MASELAKRLWMRWALRGVRYGDKYARLDGAYRIGDPWCLDSPAEEARFRETNRLIAAAFGRPGSLLEVGCGEGHQSAYLTRAAGRLTGLEVSRRAVERARRRVPEANFIVGSLDSLELRRLAPFDAAVACEVLYYMKDPAEALLRLEALARAVLVTYFEREWPRLDPILSGVRGARSSVIEASGMRWKAWWWRRG